MFEFLTLLPLLLAPPESVATNPVVTPAEFQASFDLALAGKLDIPGKIKDGASHCRYVFVGGFLNEGMSQYFKQNARELRLLGVPALPSITSIPARTSRSRATPSSFEASSRR